MQAFIDGIHLGDLTSGDIDNAALCQKLQEIYLLA